MVVHSDRLKKYVTRDDADETRRRPFPFGTVPEITRRSNSLRKTSRDLVWKFGDPCVHAGLRGT
ncbi:hypothetical protein T08_2962, partial [Trichinella sp. T8]